MNQMKMKKSSLHGKIGESEKRNVFKKEKCEIEEGGKGQWRFDCFFSHRG